MYNSTMKLGMILASLFCWIQLAAQQQVTGIVFADKNQNGVQDRGEVGVRGVSVSNGKEVVLTDARGQYVLPIQDDNIIFVIKPRDYRLPVDSNNLPQFFYNHKPNGSPKLKFAGVAPTGKLPEQVNFPLIPSPEPDQFSVLVFGDPQPRDLEDMASFSKGIIDEVAGIQGPAFTIALGDLVNDDLDLHPHYIHEMGKIGLPVFNVMGNHDMNFDVTEDHLSDETFERHFGPATYAFNYGNAHFMVLDNILYPDPRDGRGYWGGFRQDQLDFIANNLRYVPQDKLIVLAMHIPLYDEDYDPQGTFSKSDRARLFDLLSVYPHTISLSAHTHLQRHFMHETENDWTRNTPHHEFNVGTTSGDWYSGELDQNGVPKSTMRDGTPKGYAFLNVENNTFTLDYKVAGKPQDDQIAIFAPKVVAAGKRKGRAASLYANFYMGYEQDEVLFRIDGGEWKAMTSVHAPDPNYVYSLSRYDLSDTLLSGRRPSDPQPSSHLWKAAIPNHLSVGEHLIEVQASDRFGRTFKSQRTFRAE